MATVATKNIERLPRNEHLRVTPAGPPPNPLEDLYSGTPAFIDAVNGSIVSTSNAGANVCAGIVSAFYDSTNPPPGVLDVVHTEIGQEEKIAFAATAQQVGLVLYATNDGTFTLTPAGSSRLGIITARIDASYVFVKIDPVA